MLRRICMKAISTIKLVSAHLTRKFLSFQLNGRAVVKPTEAAVQYSTVHSI